MRFFVPEHRGHDDLLDVAAQVIRAQLVGRHTWEDGNARWIVARIGGATATLPECYIIGP